MGKFNSLVLICVEKYWGNEEQVANKSEMKYGEQLNSLKTAQVEIARWVGNIAQTVERKLTDNEERNTKHDRL